MTQERPSDLLGALPRTRPHRRSAKRPARLETSPAHAETKQRASARAAAPSPSAERPRTATATARASAKRTAGKPTAAAARTGAAGDQPASGRRTAAKPQKGRLRQPPQPRGIPSAPRSPVPPAPHRPEVIGTAIQAVAELTEIGLSVTARALRRTLSRLPRP